MYILFDQISNLQNDLLKDLDSKLTVGAGSLDEVQRLLLRGKREEAVSCALRCGNFALALLLASVCDHATYQSTARRFIDQALHKGSPLHTVSSLFANQIQPTESDPNEFWSDSSEDLKNTWRYHLASIMSNQTRGWKKIVISLGDQLFNLGLIHASHFCYIVSGCPVSSELDPSARLVLVGCNHKHSRNIALMTPGAIESFERTEALEWAKRKGNPNAAIIMLQNFKLKYACILADFGFEKEAKLYIDSIRKVTGLSLRETEINKSKKNAATIKTYSAGFSTHLDIFEDRLSLSLGIILPKKEKERKGIMPSIIPTFRESKPSKRDKKQEKDKSSIEQSSPNEDDGTQQTHDLDETFTSATSNLLDITSSNIPPTNQHSKHKLETYKEVNEKVTSTPVSQPTVSTPAAAPSTSPAKLNKQEEPDAGKAKVTDQSPASTGGK